MTAILAVTHAKGVALGTDSAITEGEQRWTEHAPKWCDLGPAVVALAGDVRATLLAELVGEVRKPRPREGPRAYLTDAIAGALRRALATEDIAQCPEGVIVYHGAAWRLDAGFGLWCPEGGIVGAGSGGMVARAVALALPSLEPLERIGRALEIAGEVCPGVGGKTWLRDVLRRRH